MYTWFITKGWFIKKLFTNAGIKFKISTFLSNCLYKRKKNTADCWTCTINSGKSKFKYNRILTVPPSIIWHCRLSDMAVDKLAINNFILTNVILKLFVAALQPHLNNFSAWHQFFKCIIKGWPAALFAS